jgi:glycyl-tRNA synthetase beta subunit
MSTAEGKILAEANKRITNILKKSGFPVPVGLRPDQLAQKPDPKLFKEKEEFEFWDALQKVGGRSVLLRQEHRYAESLNALSELATPTKLFFDHVLVNAKEPEIQSNRIVLIQHARAYMNQVADLSLMAS